MSAVQVVYIMQLLTRIIYTDSCQCP